MALFEIVMPKLGESIIEATIIRWLKKEGDTITEDEPIVEIATDKVDSEIPSPVAGVLKKLFFHENDIVAVGQVIAVVEMGGSISAEAEEIQPSASLTPDAAVGPSLNVQPQQETVKQTTRFYSPLVKSIAKEENLSLETLEKIKGTGKGGRLTKTDLLEYLKHAAAQPAIEPASQKPTQISRPLMAQKTSPYAATAMAGDEIIEMDRMRKLIADHMVGSVHTSPHVASFIEVDVTNLVRWRDRIKDSFAKREGEKITFTPVFVEAAAQALKEFPNVNASVEGYNIIRRRNINIGMAAALPNGNLIVPVIKNADQKNLLGLAKEVNRLANNARTNKLEPDDIAGGTFTITNFGTFGSLTGTPIINQPQVAILGIGVIKKKPVVIETEAGDMIAIRHMMILSLSYDHRIVDGALGGMFIKRMAELLEKFDSLRAL